MLHSSSRHERDVVLVVVMALVLVVMVLVMLVVGLVVVVVVHFIQSSAKAQQGQPLQYH